MPSFLLSSDRRSAAQARRFVVDALRGWDVDAAATEDAELLVSELVTNVVLHVRSDAKVRVERRGDVVWVAVHDASTTLPKPRNYGPDAVTGRGLLLVERLSSRWGAENDAHGKFVWFEVPVQRSTVGASSSE